MVMMEDLKGVLFMEKTLKDKDLISKTLQLKLAKGEAQWEDEDIQFFIPVALSFTDFDWLKLIAEHNLISEDELIVKNFLDMCESLKDVNSKTLQDSALRKLKKRFK